MIEKQDILHLGSLARMKITDEEVPKLQADINEILEYVSVISEIAGDNTATKQVGSLYNVFREDEITNEPEEYTEAALKEMPETEGRYLKVKKILSQD